MYCVLCVTVVTKLKYQTTFSCVARFFSINGQKRLNDLFKIKVSLIISQDKLLLDTLLYESDEHQDTVKKEILNLTISLIRNN